MCVALWRGDLGGVCPVEARYSLELWRACCVGGAVPLRSLTQVSRWVRVVALRQGPGTLVVDMSRGEESLATVVEKNS